MQNRMLRAARRISVGTAACAAVAMFTNANADGALMVTLSEPGFAPITFTDTTNTGSVSYFGSYGNFSTNFVVGQSDRLTGGTAAATLQIEALDVTYLADSGVTSMLTVTLTDSGYVFPGVDTSLESLDSSVGGTLTVPAAGDTIIFQSEVISPPTTTGVQTYVAPSTVSGTTSFSSVAPTVDFVRGPTYSLENITQISVSRGGESDNISGTTTVTASVPEPTGIAIVGLAAAALVRRRKQKLR